jgi:hypothetical protein
MIHFWTLFVSNHRLQIDVSNFDTFCVKQLTIKNEDKNTNG